MSTDTLVFRWPATSLPIKVFAEPVGQLPQYASDGLRAWQRQFLYGEFRATLVADSSTADLLVVLTGNPPPDTPLTDDPPRFVCEGVTFVPPRVVDGSGQLRFTSRMQIEVRAFPGADPTDAVNCLARVTTHEIGHALGIFAHSNDPFDLMFDAPTVTTPSLRDQATIQLLYHTRADVLPWDPAVMIAAAFRSGVAVR
jgi:predicted Zn-dependent protease